MESDTDSHHSRRPAPQRPVPCAVLALANSLQVQTSLAASLGISTVALLCHWIILKLTG